jgi:antirestriction protein ArdC
MGAGQAVAHRRGDERAIFTASAHAQRAADYLHGLQSAQIAGAAA